MRATQELPASYQKVGAIDVAKDQRLLVILNVIGLVVMVFSGWLFFRAWIWLRPNDAGSGFQLLQINSLAGWLVLIAAILGLTALHIVLHEAIHGIFFWLFTRSRPRFAFRISYAYAAAPGWYIPSRQHVINTLAPLVLISLLGLFLFRVAPPAWMLPVWFTIMMNAGGSVGDLLVAVWLMIHPSSGLALDTGDAVTLFLPENR